MNASQISRGFASLIASCCVFATGARATVLFSFDDHGIPYRLNLKLTFSTPTKHAANPVVRHGESAAPDALRAQFYGSVIREGAKFRMWYCALAASETVGTR